MRKILDNGYIKHVGHWGSDEEIIEAARMSTGKGFNGWGSFAGVCENGHNQHATAGIWTSVCQTCGASMKWEAGDEKLLAYLYDNKHSTPFEMAGLTIEVKAPIFVFREWHRHRTQSYNEMSARYIPLPDENYVPSVERMLIDGGTNKQAQSASAKKLTEIEAHQWVMELQTLYQRAELVYKRGIELGIPKEVARLPVPVARYSRMRASANLRNWLGFLTLRMDSHAQWEIRQYANAVGDVIAEHFPQTWKLFMKNPPK